MAKFRFTLGIGIANAKQQYIMDIPDEDFDDCETKEERQDIIDEAWQDWANNYIDGGAEEIK